MNKHQNKNVGINLTDLQRGAMAELQLSVMKKRENRRTEHDRLFQEEAKQVNDLATRFAVENNVDLRRYAFDLDEFKFIPRQIPLNETQLASLNGGRRKKKDDEVPEEQNV